MAFGFNTSKQSSTSQSTSDAFNRSQQDIWGMQTPFFQQMYGMGSGLLGQQQNVGGAAQGMVNQFMPGIMQGFGGLGNIAQTGGPVGMYANAMNPFSGQQVQQFGQQLGDFFNQQLLPGIAGNAVAAGQLGGGRQGVAQGMAAQDMLQQFQQGATGIMNNAYNTGANAANAATQAMMGAGSSLPGFAADAFNLGMSPFNAAWSPLQQMAGLLGGPTVLGQSEGGSSSQSTSRGRGSSLGFNMGGGSLFG